MEILGIDIGGSGIKGAPVETGRGELLAERYRMPTPQPATPDAMGDSVADLVRYFGWHGPIGCTLPSVIKNGVVYSAANIDRSWIGADGQQLLEQKTGCRVSLINDADAAGIAEMRFGVGVDQPGVVIFLTLGTGVGSGVFNDGVLVPNTEFGHLEIRGREAERRSASVSRTRRGLSWKAWTIDLDEHLDRIQQLMWPNLMIIGGGVSKNADRFIPRLTVRCPVVPALLRNDAGIIGAAIVAAEAPAPQAAAPATAPIAKD
jgi:polyphosphate glucokinase